MLSKCVDCFIWLELFNKLLPTWFSDRGWIIESYLKTCWIIEGFSLGMRAIDDPEGKISSLREAATSCGKVAKNGVDDSDEDNEAVGKKSWTCVNTDCQPTQLYQEFIT